jgi:hypothetical protein
MRALTGRSFGTLCRIAGTALWVASALAAVAVANSAQAQTTPGRVPQPVIESARGDQCVADPAFMRRNHMELLKHQRDDTVHGGIRGAKYSLKACIDCHASQKTGSVAAASTNFCQSCHTFTAVKIDCFECHYTKPTPGTALSAPAQPTQAAATLQVQRAAVTTQVKP